MEDKHLDRIFKEKLNQLQTNYDPESWELLEQKMDGEGFGASEANDQLVDEKVFNKLHRLEVAYKSSHWARMAALLDDEFFFDYKIIRYKSMELAMLFLLVFAIVQYLPYHSTTLENVPQENQNNNQINSAEELIQANLEPDSEVQKGNALTDLAEQANDPAVAINQSAKNEDSSTQQPEARADESAIPGEVTVTITQGSSGILAPINTLQYQALKRVVESPAYIRSLWYKQMPKNSYFSNSTGLLASLSRKEIDPLEYKLESLLIQKRKKKHHTRIGIFGSIDYNRVLTPPNASENITGFERYALGYGGGISIGFEFGRFEVESGFIYAAKQYKPLPVLFVQGSVRDGFFAEGVKDIELNMLNIPLNLRYNFYVKNKWRFYALTGLSLQMAYQANYYTANQDGFRTNNFLPAPAPAAPPEGSPAILNDNLNKGLFEGGSFSENSYLTGNFGLGMDYYFTSRWSFFAQPTYQHSINYFIDGIGPLHDRINNFSIFTGIKVKL